MKWLRNLVRRNTKPIEYRHALAWKDRLSLAYMLIAWNAFGFVCYMAFTGRSDWAKYHGLKSDEEGRTTSCTYSLQFASYFFVYIFGSLSAQQWAKTLKIEKAKVIQIKGFQKVNEFEIGGEEGEEAQNATDEELN